jgi:DNA-binding GntR family transcriptional regulator
MGASTDPVYLRVLEDLRARISEGLLEPGARVPSRNAIIARYGVGETAAKHVLQVLAAEGLIEARAGSGSYVRKAPVTQLMDHDRLRCPGSPFSPGEPAGRLALEYRVEQVPPPPSIARRLGLPPGTDAVMRTRYLLSADGVAIQLTTSYEPVQVTGGTVIAAPDQGTFAGCGVIERMNAIGICVDEVTEEISVRPSLRSEATMLAISPGALVLLVQRTHLAGGTAVEAADIVLAADSFRLRYRIPV